jgi:hypothetical protein
MNAIKPRKHTTHKGYDLARKGTNWSMSLEERQDIFVAPSWVAGDFCEAIVVLRVAPYISHVASDHLRKKKIVNSGN